MSDTIGDLRVSYERGELHESGVDRDPIAQFRAWLDEAVNASLLEPSAMTLATVDDRGRPDARIVLLRGVDERGFVFFTNYDSRKGRELAQQPRAALVFYWGALERQVRVEGSVERCSPEESDDYFARRPRGHRLSAWASPQSTIVADRAYLEARMTAFERDYEGRDVERPPYWGGFRVVPEGIEFWQGRRSRVHDRLRYERDGSAWRIERLAP